MATLQQLEQALVKADAAGNAFDAKLIADAIRRMRAEGQIGVGGAPSPAFDQTMQTMSDLSQQIKGKVTPQGYARPGSYGDSPFAQGMSGINQGIANTLGFPIEASNWLLRAGSFGLNKATGGAVDLQWPVEPFGGFKTFTDLGKSVGAIREPSADPAKQFLRRASEDVGGALIPGLGMMGRVAAPARFLTKELGLAAASGTGAAAAQQIAPDQPWLQTAASLAGMGTLAGLGRLGRRMITPFPARAGKPAAAATLAQEGVPLTAGQATGSKGLQYAESELGGGATANFMDNQSEQFTRAVLRRAGINARRATPDVIDGAFTRIGNDFDDLAARNQIAGDQQLVQDLGAAWSEYTNVVNPTRRVPIVENTLRDIFNALYHNGGTIDGAAYQSLRSALDKAARAARTSDPQLMDALFSIRNSLDDAMARNLSPEDAALWAQAREQYRNMIVIEQAATGAGENAAMGLITPAQLRQAVVNQGRRNYVRGRGAFADLAHAGNATMTPLPQSGTAPRAAVRAIPAVIGAGIGGTIANLPGAMLGAAVPAVMGRAILSGPGRAYLGNQLLAAPGVRPTGIPALMGAGINQSAPPVPPMPSRLLPYF